MPNLSPTQLAAEQLKQQLGGEASVSPTPQPGFFSKVGSGINNTVQNTLPTAATNLFQGIAEPFEKVLGSGIRSLQATPDIFNEAKQLDFSKPLNQPQTYAGKNPDTTMAQPINVPGVGQIPTMQGSSNTQNLGTAAQAASFLTPGLGLGGKMTGALAGGLNFGGAALQSPNATAGGVLGQTALGVGAGVATAALPDLASKGHQLMTDHPIFQRAPTPIFDPSTVNLEGTGTSALHLPEQNVYAKISPAQQDFLSNEVKNIPFNQGDQPHLTPLEKLQSGTGAPSAPKEVSLDELKGMSPNAKTALESFDKNLKPEQLAQQARAQAGTAGVKGVSDIQSGMSQGESTLGNNFRDAATKVAQGDSAARLNLTNNQVSALNDLKEGKNFDLPDYLKNAETQVDSGTGKFGSVKLTPKAQAEFEAAGKTSNTSLTPEQSQDLIRRLNKSTYKEVGGQLQTDQQRVDLTNEIKQSAQSSFGHVTDANGESVWNKAYQDYASGKEAANNFKKLLGINPSKDLSGVAPDKIMNKLLTLGKTPEGKVMLQNAIDDVSKETGIDFTDPTKAVHGILDKQIALEDTQTAANKPSLLKEIFDPKYLGRRAVGGAVTVGVLYPLLRELEKVLSKNN